MEAVCNGTPPSGLTCQQKRLSLHQGVLYRTFRESASSSPITQILVPCKLWPRILEELHNKTGHFGVHKTLEKVRERFYWPSYEVEVNQWVRECQECQRKNSPQPLPQAELETIKATCPFQKLYHGISQDHYQSPTVATNTSWSLLISSVSGWRHSHWKGLMHIHWQWSWWMKLCAVMEWCLQLFTVTKGPISAVKWSDAYAIYLE